MGSKEAAMNGGAKNKVGLIPWDPENEAHYQRMYEQRVVCTWGQDEIAEWRDNMVSGTKFMYWIVLEPGTVNRDKMLADHVTQYPKEKEPLVDTAARLGSASLTPSHAEFTPIGHIGMEVFPERNESLSLPLSTYWVKSLYVSWALQSSGLGRDAMRQLEETATSPPFNCSVMALDTVKGDFQKSEESLRAFYDDRGLPRPDVIRTNEEWYIRQGYKIIGTREAAYVWTHPGSGEVHKIPCFYFKKDLVRAR